MKTKQFLSIVLILIFIGIHAQSNGQSLFEDTLVETYEFSISPQDLDIRTYELSLDEEFIYDTSLSPKSISEYEAQENPVVYALSMIAFAAGFGFTDLETLWCLHAAYYLRLAMLGNKAFYGSLGVGYNYTNAEFLTVGLLDITLKAMMFSLLAKRYKQVRAQYGAYVSYAFGSNKFIDGIKNDITRLSFGVVVGLHILLSPLWSIMIQTNLITHRIQTIKSDGAEVKDDITFGLINKANLLNFSLVYIIPDRRKQ